MIYYIYTLYIDYMYYIYICIYIDYMYYIYNPTWLTRCSDLRFLFSHAPVLMCDPHISIVQR